MSRSIKNEEEKRLQAEKAAKELGMKIPTASFSKMRDRLDKLTRIQ